MSNISSGLVAFRHSRNHLVKWDWFRNNCTLFCHTHYNHLPLLYGNIEYSPFSVVISWSHSSRTRSVCKACWHSSPTFDDHRALGYSKRVSAEILDIISFIKLQLTFEYVYPIRLAAFKQHWSPFARLCNRFPQQTPCLGAIISPKHWLRYLSSDQKRILGSRPLYCWMYSATQCNKGSKQAKLLGSWFIGLQLSEMAHFEQDKNLH